ncbi:DUF4287 domain-containing protein [uncultured Nocardioides sp.]|uniref:DUF4287 domain-containing protein n=1 Tax=uncultured Nocardioides sp. TaxID=198441 RepID=UPI0025CD1173|nr:DUF4287 domain-containing protein [uncultured Nocardioides sp.]
MSFQAYLDTIETRTGLTPRQLLDQARQRGFGPGTRAREIVTWLAEDHDLGRGHAMAMVHVVTRGDRIATTHVGTTGTHRDEADRLWLDGRATRPW